MIDDELLDTVPCDRCGEETDDPRCDHGQNYCPDCWHDGACHLCDREAGEEEAAERRLGFDREDAWEARDA